MLSRVLRSPEKREKKRREERSERVIRVNVKGFIRQLNEGTALSGIQMKKQPTAKTREERRKIS